MQRYWVGNDEGMGYEEECSYGAWVYYVDAQKEIDELNKKVEELTLRNARLTYILKGGVADEST
jgi:hypothetical protein